MFWSKQKNGLFTIERHWIFLSEFGEIFVITNSFSDAKLNEKDFCYFEIDVSSLLAANWFKFGRGHRLMGVRAGVIKDNTKTIWKNKNKKKIPTISFNLSAFELSGDENWTFLFINNFLVLSYRIIANNIIHLYFRLYSVWLSLLFHRGS